MKAMVLIVGMAIQFSFAALHSQEVLLPLQTMPSQPAATKAGSGAVGLPFFDDFAGQGSVPSASLWESGGVTVEAGARLMPPTVGVATLDVGDASGELYSQQAQTLFGADTLMSRPLRLDGLRVADSVVLSFYYLPGGGWGNLWERVGYAPGENDSLMLDFYRPTDSTWVTVWSRAGVEVDTLLAQTGRDWQYVAITIDDNAFFDSTFRFRFRNYGSLFDNGKPGMTGNCDYWHLDYVLLDQGRTAAAVPVFRDVAFVSPAPMALATYRAMPARQYRASDMADSMALTITNLFNSALATHYSYAVVDSGGDTLHRYDGGFENAPPFLPDGSYQQAAAHARPAVSFAFPESDLPREYTVVHTIREGVGGDDYGANDTVRYRQEFGNYYAYDDGGAENGYGITSTASRIYLAVRFDLNVEDTLTAIDLCFNRTLDGENERIPIRLTVWAARDGRPGDVLYRDADARMPEAEGLNRFHRYLLDAPVEVPAGSLFVGFEQLDNDYINLGFDRSFNSASRIYYLTGTEWQQSILSGSLMLRPCFGTSATVGIGEREEVSGAWKVYPNPASDAVQIDGLPEESRVELYDAMGRRVLSSSRPALSTVHLPNGLYLLRCVTPQGGVFTSKLIIRH